MSHQTLDEQTRRIAEITGDITWIVFRTEDELPDALDQVLLVK